MTNLKTGIQIVLHDVDAFAANISGLKLRRYQLDAAKSIIKSVIFGEGYTFVVMFPRQSGKNELQAQIETYLLTMLRLKPAEIVKVSPTWKPQSLNAMRRLERVLKRNPAAGLDWEKESGYIYRVGEARIFFLSGSPPSNVVGATASALLECDEAQDVLISKWDKDFAPMAASANATRVFWGTAWTSQTLLARELRAARAAQEQDGVQRVFVCSAAEVSAEAPAYAQFITQEIEKFGLGHPTVRTQYFSEEIDADTGMFPAGRRALMRGGHPAEEMPTPGEIYAFLLDVAGEFESSTNHSSLITHHESLSTSPTQDSTALTIVRVDLSLLDSLGAPRYLAVQRRTWTGIKHTQLFGQLLALAESWQPRYIVCDSTGVGAGLTSFLEKFLGRAGGAHGVGNLHRAAGGLVIPFVFTQSSKSKLGWDFLSIIETGRFLDHRAVRGSLQGSGQPAADGCSWAATGPTATAQEVFWMQLEQTQYKIMPGPGKTMRWSVPDGTRDPTNGELVHDDLVISAALCAVLDAQTWGLAESIVLRGADPLAGLGEVF